VRAMIVSRMAVDRREFTSHDGGVDARRIGRPWRCGLP
jgi:hypothetical protein